MTAYPDLHRHCERSEAIQTGDCRRNLLRIASAAVPPRNDAGVNRRGRRRTGLRGFLVLLALLPALLATAALAVEPDEMLADPALEARARDISKELRCVVCQNQSIDDSNAGIARDLRILVRERLAAGDSDREVKDFIVARYGDYVLLDPPFKPATWALWVGPPVMAFVVVSLIVVFVRTWRNREAAGGEVDTLSPTDRAELDALVERLARDAPPPPPRSAFRAELDQPRTPMTMRPPGEDDEPDAAPGQLPGRAPDRTPDGTQGA